MKNNTTFEHEYDNLHQLFTKRLFDEAEVLATRMLSDYNKFDYELLLKRARIRQCLMRYDEALVDAGLALSNCPERSEAYFIVSDCLIATQKLSEAMKLLEVINKREPNSQIIKSQYDMLRPLFQRQQVTLNDLNVRYCSLSGDLDPEVLERQTSKKESASAPICEESSFNCLS